MNVPSTSLKTKAESGLPIFFFLRVVANRLDETLMGEHRF